LELKRLSFKNKNNKTVYYLKNYLKLFISTKYFQKKLATELDKIKNLNTENYKQVILRFNYYNQLNKKSVLSSNAQKLSELKLQKAHKTYYFDLNEYSKYFNQDLKGHFLFGDITKIPEEPGLVKSRPINNKNINSVLLKWNKIRHFTFISKDDLPYTKKKDQLVFRAKVHSSQPQRIKFLEKHYGHPMCNIGKVNSNNLNRLWMVKRMTYLQQLQYKFILCLEGNDVASNLKWVMSSNSIAVMPKPKYETWFMEGRLIADHHYIEIKDDYSDLESKLRFFIKHPKKAELIIENANKHVNQFKDQKKEDLISVMVLDKYFKNTN
tara:strand:- start:1184 stop:2155 length:972 start_codon:yes stop_codon:yes gene_type:complete